MSRVKVHAAAVGMLLVGCATSGAPLAEKAGRRVQDNRVGEVGMGSGFACARLSSGRVRCWGRNDAGQIGDGTELDRSTPRDVVGLNDAVSLSVQSNRSCVVHEDGGVSCWGDSWLPGQPEPDRTPFRIPGIDDAVTVHVGDFHACVIRRGGAVSCWGSNQSGQLGSGAKGGNNPVIEVPIDHVVSVALAFQNTCAVKSDGGVWCWGDNPLQTARADGTEAWLQPTRVPTGFTFVELHAGFGHYCGRIEEDGKVACFGEALGPCSFGFQPSPEQLDGVFAIPGVRDVVAMGGPDCALVGDDLLCWDDREPAEPEDPDAWPQCLGTRTSLGPVREVSATHGRGCAIMNDGVRCWEPGAVGELGDGLQDAAEPRLVAGMFEADAPDIDWTRRLRNEVPRNGLSGSALVWYDAPLFAAPDATQPVARRGEPVRRYAKGSGHFPVTIATDHGELVEVHNLDARSRRDHCGWFGEEPREGLSLAGYELTFFVRKDDLAPVLASIYADSHEDGSVLMVAPGTPVQPGSQSLSVEVGSATVPVYSEPADLALSYVVEDIPSPPEGLPDNCDTDTPARLLGRAFNLDALPWDMTWRCRVDEGDVPGTMRVVLHDRCVHVEAIVEQNPHTQGGGGGLGMRGSAPAEMEWTIDAGADAFWRDGTRAGRKRTTQTTTTEPAPTDGRLCWSFGHDFELCHDAADVRAEILGPR